MDSPRPRLYFFGWPSHLGGADTKLAHLLLLLHRHCRITVVPNDESRLKETYWCKFLDRLGVHATLLSRLGPRLEGFALSLSNGCFFTRRIADKVKERGLRTIWSSEMMWHHEGELEAAKQGLIDHVLYVSEFQREALRPGYGTIPGTITGNYIDPGEFPWIERRNATFAIGRLSRPAWEKYPEDFPVFYERLGLPDTRLRVMAWNDELSRKYSWHRFDSRRWELLPANSEPQAQFLQSLDLFVYPLGHTFRESWGRSTVEAMLTGCIPLVPRGHHFENLVIDGKTGFLCDDFSEWQDRARRLRWDYPFRASLSRKCHEHAVSTLCNAETHRRCWLDMLASVETATPSALVTP
jgi:glycosyltransferase involved in cell wall biosynthesis